MDKILEKLKHFTKYYSDTEEKNLSLHSLRETINASYSQPVTNTVPLNFILSFAQKLITIPSTSDNSKGLHEAITVVKKQVADFTIESFTSKGKQSLLIHNRKRGTKRFKIILNAHVDVVAGKDHQFSPYIENGKLYGRGAYDMKATAAVMLTVFKEIAALVPYPLALQIVTDEELVLGAGTKIHLDKGIRSDFAILGECGSNQDIIYENKGIIHATITTYGTSAHGAYPWKGKNAIAKMQEVISIIHKHYPIPEYETFETTINISDITTTNKEWNQIPEECIATLDIRVNHKEFHTILNRLKLLLPEDVSFHIVKTLSPFYTNPNNKFIQYLTYIAEKKTGRIIKKRKTFGGSDAAFFTEKKLAAIEFGPVGHGQHHDDEWVKISSLEEYYLILKNFLLSIK